MQNREFIDSSNVADKFEPEQNEMTVLDESIPSPKEIQTDETIVLPEIISMPDYIRCHYEKDLIRACINQIYDLTLCVVYDGKLFHDVPGLGPIDSSEEEMVLTDVPTPIEWGEPKPFSFDRNVYSATIRPIDGAITWIEKAGFRLRNTPEHLIYRSILQTMYMEKLAMIQKLLVKCGCSELKLKEKSE